MIERKTSKRATGGSVHVNPGTYQKLSALAADRGLTLREMMAALVDAEHERQPPKTTRRRTYPATRRSRWTADTVTTAIAKRRANGDPVNSWAVQMADSGLWEGGCRVFGSWADALKAAGVELPDKTCGRPASGLARMRGARGFSQERLAQLAGTSQSHISNLERGTAFPTRTMLAALAHALTCNEAMLLAEGASVT